MNYERFQKIKGKSHLAKFFNSIMKRLESVRMVCAPVSFSKDKEISSFQDEKFADFCRYEVWMHSVVERLYEWKGLIDEYNQEFHGKWKYYASYKRMSFIRENGGEKDDYNADGSIKAEVPDSMLDDFSLKSELYMKDFMDIVQDTSCYDLKGLVADLIASSQIDIIEEMKNFFGVSVPIYKNEDGQMRKVTGLEHSMDMVNLQLNAEDDAVRVKAVASTVTSIILMIKKCDYNNDNTELLEIIHSTIDGLLDMNFTKVQSKVHDFLEMYADDIHKC